jgi:hypothetical protein
MKILFQGDYTLDPTNRVVTLKDIQLQPEQVLMITNVTAGAVYYLFTSDNPASVSVVGDDTRIVFQPYKDCDSHSSSDALAIYIDDGTALSFAELIDRIEDLDTLVGAEFNETQTALSNLNTLVGAEFNETQTALSNLNTLVGGEFNETQTALTTISNKIPSQIDDRIPVLPISSLTLNRATGFAPATSQEVLPANSNRKYLLVQNLSSAPFHINFTDAASTSTLRIDALGAAVFESGVVPTNAINMVRTVANQQYYIVHA